MSASVASPQQSSFQRPISPFLDSNSSPVFSAISCEVGWIRCSVLWRQLVAAPNDGEHVECALLVLIVLIDLALSEVIFGPVAGCSVVKLCWQLCRAVGLKGILCGLMGPCSVVVSRGRWLWIRCALK